MTANCLRNLAEIGNQPVNGTRRVARGSLGGRGRVPRGTVPGGLYPHSEVGSGGLGCHNDHSRLLGQPHSRVEQAYQPVLHHPDDGHGMAMAKMPLKGRGCSPGGMTGWGRCGSEASYSSRALRCLLLRSGWGVGMGVASQSVGGDDEDRRLVDLSEHVRNLLVLPVVSPDHPDPAARWHLCEHPEGAIATLVKLVDPVEGSLDLLGGEAVGGNLLQAGLTRAFGAPSQFSSVGPKHGSPLPLRPSKY